MVLPNCEFCLMKIIRTRVIPRVCVFLGNFLEVCVFTLFSEAVASTISTLFSEAVASTISIAVIDGSYWNGSAFVLHNM